MTDTEVVLKMANRQLCCDKECFALVNRFLNNNAHQARVQYICDDLVEFTVEPLEMPS